MGSLRHVGIGPLTNEATNRVTFGVLWKHEKKMYLNRGLAHTHRPKFGSKTVVTGGWFR